MLRRVLWIAAASALLIAIGLPGYIALRRDLVGGPDDADLSVARESISPQDDGLNHLLAAVQLMRMSDRDELLAAAVWAGEDSEHEAVGSLLEANAQALERLRRALSAPHFRLPDVANAEMAVAPEIPLETERLVDLLRLQAQHAASLGKWETAFGTTLDILRLAQRIEGARHAVLTTTLLSLGYRAKGLEALRRLVAIAPLGNAQARQWVNMLPEYRSNPAAWKRMWAAEYQQWKALLAWIADNAQHNQPPHDPDASSAEIAEVDIEALLVQTRRALETFADMTRTYQRASEQNCTDLGDLLFPPAGSDDSEALADLGEIGIEINAPDYRHFFLRRCTQDTALAATQTLIALRAFQQDQGGLPEQLADLIPDYLDAIPTDSFNGAPLQYSRADKVLYALKANSVESAEPKGPAVTAGRREPSYPIDF